jgi:UDP-MurNAc hydroxylase
MRVAALGHAGLRVRTADAEILCDPWFSPEGAFQGSWHQFPANDHLLESPDLFEPTAIAISHEHLDHVDPWFLARVPGVPVIVPRYPSPVLKNKIRAGGPREIIELDQWEVFEISAETKIFFVSEPPMNHDSAMVIQGDGRNLLNLNDARLFPVQFREIRQRVGGTIDIFSFQGAGASWYPMCYRYPAERAEKLSKQKRMTKFAYCFKAMRVVDPVVGLPFAGPPAFLDPALMKHNAEMERGIFPDQQQIADWLCQRGIDNTAVLLPGDEWDAEERVKIGHPHFADFSFSDRWSYIEEYATRRKAHIDAVLDRHPLPQDSLWPAFKEYFDELLGMNPFFNAKIGMRVGFDVTGPGGGRWSVDFRPGSEAVLDDLEDCAYNYSLESRWLPPLLERRVPWEDFFLSLRFEAWRDPDLYNDHLLGLLKFAEPEALNAVEAFETGLASDERITIHSEGRVYSISRYCPHQGNDLLNTGEVQPGGTIVCLAHHYEFDLATGRCVNGSCTPIEVEEMSGSDASS